MLPTAVTRHGTSDLWTAIRNSPTVDPNDLLAAVIAECDLPGPNKPTRILSRDSLPALAAYWGEPWLAAPLSDAANYSASGLRILTIFERL